MGSGGPIPAAPGPCGYADFIGLETDASYIKTWEPTAVPGWLR